MRHAAQWKPSLRQLAREGPSIWWRYLPLSQDCSGSLDSELVELEKANTEWDDFVNSGAERHGIKAKAGCLWIAKPGPVRQVHTILVQGLQHPALASFLTNFL